MNVPTIQRKNDELLMPGLASVHSHAFQRALRGRTQRRSSAADSFWSWRGLMYALAEQLDPDDLYTIAVFAYLELALSGITAVGEFHYVHHDRSGTPYATRTATAEVLIEAAKAVGLRICLIRAAYLRGGYQQELTAAQRRFYDPSIDLVLGDIDQLRARYHADPAVQIGVAAHSIRAVPIEAVQQLAQYAQGNGLPLHMHVAEQRRELLECRAEYGTTPVDLLAQYGILHKDFVAIHATHLSEQEMKQLGAARALIGLCRTTERDLGDGTADVSGLVQAGARLCFGVDSHASSDAFEEIRAAELDMRTRAEARHVAADAPLLLRAASEWGYAALGLNDHWQHDHVTLDAHDPSIVGADERLLEDAVIFGATPRAVKHVDVGGTRIVEHGQHPLYEQARQNFQRTLKTIIDQT